MRIDIDKIKMLMRYLADFLILANFILLLPAFLLVFAIACFMVRLKKPKAHPSVSSLTPEQKAQVDLYQFYGKEIEHLDEIPARQEYFNKRLKYYRKEAEKNGDKRLRRKTA